MERGQQGSQQHTNDRSTMLNITWTNDVPLSYIHSKDSFVPNTVKFTYMKSVETVKIIAHARAITGVPTITSDKETYTSDQPAKIYLKTYSHTTKEDCEHFFEAFEKLKKELRTEWDKSKVVMTNDATVLFEAFDEMLTGVVANAQWNGVLGMESSRTWAMFKAKVAEFITTKVLPEDAYSRQVSFMRERSKPRSLTAKDWWSRIQTLNQYLPYFFTTIDEFKEHYPTETFRSWWVTGGLTELELKQIVTTRAPKAWQDSLAL